MDALTALFVMAAMIIALCFLLLIGWVAISVGLTVLAWYRGEDHKQVWADQMSEW